MIPLLRPDPYLVCGSCTHCDTSIFETNSCEITPQFCSQVPRPSNLRLSFQVCNAGESSAVTRRKKDFDTTVSIEVCCDGAISIPGAVRVGRKSISGRANRQLTVFESIILQRTVHVWFQHNADFGHSIGPEGTDSELVAPPRTVHRAGRNAFASHGVNRNSCAIS